MDQALASRSRTFIPRAFRPPVWARSAHAQTLAGKLLRPRPTLPLRRERWETPDGDVLELDFADQGLEGAPLVVVLHGLEGNALRPYALQSYLALRARGVAAVGLNFRGCGGEPNRLPRFYHSGETGDPLWVLERLRAGRPDRPLGALGFSLGGNILLRLLGGLNTRGQELVRAAAVISVPFELSAGADTLESGPMVRTYARFFLRSLIAKVEAKRELLAPHLRLDRARSARTLRAFDDAVTAPLHGFRDAAHYYESCSSARCLHSVHVPTLVMHSRDDPFLPAAVIPEAALRANPAFAPVITDRGGTRRVRRGSTLGTAILG